MSGIPLANLEFAKVWPLAHLILIFLSWSATVAHGCILHYRDLCIYIEIIYGLICVQRKGSSSIIELKF